MENPELELVRRRHLDDFRRIVTQSVREALAGLPPEQRNLLRLHLVDAVSLRKIAALQGAAVATLAREYGRVRDGILGRIRAVLQERTGLPARDIDSLLTTLASRISVSVSALQR
jgi:RNA polymerase sigma-70 factor (ECF subfamily)